MANGNKNQITNAKLLLKNCSAPVWAGYGGLKSSRPETYAKQ